MAQILVRGLTDDVVERLKIRAQAHGRSVEGEVRSILESASGFSEEQVREVLAKWEERFAGRRFSDSCELLAEDRNR
jgi:antitoxin FitA